MLEKWEIAHISTNWQEYRAGRWAMLMLYAGLRRGEALALRWDDIDWEHNIIHVRRAVHFEGNCPVLGTTKTDTSVRDVPMFPVLRRCLQMHDANEVYVCSSASGKLVTDAVWKSSWQAFNNAMSNLLNGEQAVRPGRRSDLDAPDRKTFCVRAHDLRHTFCSLLYDAGVDVLTAQKFMGHSSPEITMRIYTHLSADKHESDIDKATAYLERMTSAF
jgi:integrase